MISRTPEQKIKRLLSRFIPLVGWRVPVSLYRGLERVSGEPATVLTAGPERMVGYIPHRFFIDQPQVEHFGRIPLWKLPAFLEGRQPSVDLTAITVDRLSARLLFKRNYLVSPAWVASWMPIPDDLELRSLAKTSHSLSRDLIYVRNGRFTCDISNSAEDLDLFYDRYYMPYIYRRHAQLINKISRAKFRSTFQHGWLLWLFRDGERQAGALLTGRGRFLELLALGIADGNLELLRQGTTTALYLNALRHGRAQGLTDFYFGGSRPSLHDGVFRYKRKWGAILCENPRINYEMLLHWNRMEGVVASFLSGTSIIYHDSSKLSALWAYPSDLPLTAERIQKEYKAIDVQGLSSLRILLPDNVPANVDCSKNIQLINYKSMQSVTPEALGLLG